MKLREEGVDGFGLVTVVDPQWYATTLVWWWVARVLALVRRAIRIPGPRNNMRFALWGTALGMGQARLVRGWQHSASAPSLRANACARCQPQRTRHFARTWPALFAAMQSCPPERGRSTSLTPTSAQRVATRKCCGV